MDLYPLKQLNLTFTSGDEQYRLDSQCRLDRALRLLLTSCPDGIPLTGSTYGGCVRSYTETFTVKSLLSFEIQLVTCGIVETISVYLNHPLPDKAVNSNKATMILIWNCEDSGKSDTTVDNNLIPFAKGELENEIIEFYEDYLV